MKNLLPFHFTKPEELSQPHPQKQCKKWRISLAGIALLLAVGASLLTIQSARANSIIVDAAGNCTLAEAIITANNESNQPGCARGDNGGPDVITLQTNVNITVPLPAVINGELTIQSEEGHQYTIQLNSSAPITASILRVGGTGNLSLSNVIVSGGWAQSSGGGITNLGTLAVLTSTISGNRADEIGGGIYNAGTLNVENSFISGNQAEDEGGGIYSISGTVTIQGSTITGNTALSSGGGIYIMQSPETRIQNSTISNNSADEAGGGIFNQQGDVPTENSTISGNTANNGGGVYNNGTVSLQNSTVSGNVATTTAGGIYNDGTLRARNSIVGQQTTGVDCDNSGSVVSFGYNIESSTTCGFGTSDDLQNTNPLLLPLANGVHVPQNNSPAIDAANPATPLVGGTACPATDQRGTNRSDLRCDVGAVEVQLSDTDTIIKAIPGTGTFTFGPTLVQIEVFTQTGTLTEITATHHVGDHPNAAYMDGQWWDIAATGTGFLANLNLPHAISPDSDARVCRHVSGSTWDCVRNGSTTRRVWRNGLSAFSDWAVSDATPSAIALERFKVQNMPQKHLLALLLVTFGTLTVAWLAFRRRRKGSLLG